MFGTDPQSIRLVYIEAWQKYRSQETLNDLEKQVLSVLLAHKEYHALMEQADKAATKHYHGELGETNPYLHMGLHLAIRDQVSLDKPQGVKNVYDALVAKHDPHVAEHKMMEVLALALWRCQQADAPAFDEGQYMQEMKALLQ